jgi:DNA invertase Pin-like site-specific DNA recombinase
MPSDHDRPEECLQAATYTRQSSMSQPDELGEQMNVCLRLIAEYGWAGGPVYVDEATSGGTPYRSSYSQLVIDARERRFGVVVALQFDRLTRDYDEAILLFEELSSLGIKIVTVREGLITKEDIENLAMRTTLG